MPRAKPASGQLQSVRRDHLRFKKKWRSLLHSYVVATAAWSAQGITWGRIYTQCRATMPTRQQTPS